MTSRLPLTEKITLDLDAFLAMTFKTEDGRELNVKATAVDTGGHHTQAVYKYCKPRLSRRVFAIKGVGGEGKPIVGRPSTNNHIKCKLFPIGVDTAKEMVYSHLKIKDIGPGYCHFPKTYNDEYFAMLTAEKVVKKYHKGFHRREWVKVRQRNEALDCRVYALAALSIVGVNVNIIAQRSMAKKPDDENEVKSNQKVRRKVTRRDGGFVNGWR
jgi:terminase, large subunit